MFAESRNIARPTVAAPCLVSVGSKDRLPNVELREISGYQFQKLMRRRLLHGRLHASRDVGLQLCARSGRVLRPGGRSTTMSISVPKSSPLSTRCTTAAHHGMLHPAGARNLLERAGFSEIQIAPKAFSCDLKMNTSKHNAMPERARSTRIAANRRRIVQ